MTEYPESGDYVVGRFEISARVTDGVDSEGYHGPPSPVVIVSSVKAAHAFLTATPADARGLASALRVAADQADQDAGVAIVQDNTPEWLKKLSVSVYASRTSELAALQETIDAQRAVIARLSAELAGRLDPPVTQVLKTETARLAAELDTVTAERDNALAELANCPDEGYADAHRAPVDLNAMRAKLSAKAPVCTCVYPLDSDDGANSLATPSGHHPDCALSN